ncbi:MAG: methionine--tRNA ligase [Flavobacteriales bacterium]|nr:methionine--tRNA ligase [Flavobacteriales bacterium]|tara:strand:- start:8655 stop:10337 length:1683 start_codon:yes stop_codon:yes gene_type:complete
MSKKYKRYTITAALPYTNGPIHIGHLSGVYLPSDIYARYLRLNKKDVLFLCGSDEHGVPIKISAKKEGVHPQKIVDKYHNLIDKIFKDFGISFDIYYRTSDKLHHRTASDFFLKLLNKKILYKKESLQYYDEYEQQFLADRYIQGECPYCGNKEAYGDQCEKCGSTLSPKDLINPKSKLSGNSPILKKTTHWYLPLDKYQSTLKSWISKKKLEWRPNVFGQCNSWLNEGLKPRAVTRDLDWGVNLPIDKSKNKVLYVWFDAPIGYISATKKWAEKSNKDWEPYWKSSQTKLIHFIGKDNIVFHCIIFPVMLEAHGEFILPNNIPANEFLNLEGAKISTSRNWAVWLDKYLLDFKDMQDVLRYVLCITAPQTKDNDFTWKDFQIRNNSELVSIYGNFINRVVSLVNNYFGGIVPERGISISKNDKKSLNELNKLVLRIEEYIEKFKFKEAITELINIPRLGNKYLAEEEPWKEIKVNLIRTKTILNISLHICSVLAIVSEPFLPFTSEKLKSILGLKKTYWSDSKSVKILVEGSKISKSILLFRKIEDFEIKNQIDLLNKN